MGTSSREPDDDWRYATTDLMAVPGNSAVRTLANALRAHFTDSGIEIDEIDDEQDAIGWRLRCCPRLFFSVSTHAGALPEDTYDLQVSVIDATLNNGEIIFGPDSPDLGVTGVCEVVEKFALRRHR